MPEGPEKDALLKRLAKGRAKSAAEESGVDFNEAEWEANYAPNGSSNNAGEVEDKVAKAEALGEELAKGSKAVASKKSVSKRKPAEKKKAKKKAAGDPNEA
jgi:hypothetical protein